MEIRVTLPGLKFTRDRQTAQSERSERSERSKQSRDKSMTAVASRLQISSMKLIYHQERQSYRVPRARVSTCSRH